MEVFDAVKFKKLFAKVKEQKEHEDTKQLGIEMATTGKVEEFMKYSYKELSEALTSLFTRMEDVGKISEKLEHIRVGFLSAKRMAGPRRMW